MASLHLHSIGAAGICPPLLLINPYTFIASIMGEIVFASFLVFYFRFRYLGELVLIALLYFSSLFLQQASSADLNGIYTDVMYHKPQNGFEFALLFLLFCKALFVLLSSFPKTKHGFVAKIAFYVPRLFWVCPGYCIHRKAFAKCACTILLFDKNQNICFLH